MITSKRPEYKLPVGNTGRVTIAPTPMKGEAFNRYRGYSILKMDGCSIYEVRDAIDEFIGSREKKSELSLPWINERLGRPTAYLPCGNGYVLISPVQDGDFLKGFEVRGNYTILERRDCSLEQAGMAIDDYARIEKERTRRMAKKKPVTQMVGPVGIADAREEAWGQYAIPVREGAWIDVTTTKSADPRTPIFTYAGLNIVRAVNCSEAAAKAAIDRYWKYGLSGSAEKRAPDMETVYGPINSIPFRIYVINGTGSMYVRALSVDEVGKDSPYGLYRGLYIISLTECTMDEARASIDRYLEDRQLFKEKFNPPPSEETVQKEVRLANNPNQEPTAFNIFVKGTDNYVIVRGLTTEEVKPPFPYEYYRGYFMLRLMGCSMNEARLAIDSYLYDRSQRNAEAGRGNPLPEDESVFDLLDKKMSQDEYERKTPGPTEPPFPDLKIELGPGPASGKVMVAGQMVPWVTGVDITCRAGESPRVVIEAFQPKRKVGAGPVYEVSGRIITDEQARRIDALLTSVRDGVETLYTGARTVLIGGALLEMLTLVSQVRTELGRDGIFSIIERNAPGDIQDLGGA